MSTSSNPNLGIAFPDNRRRCHYGRFEAVGQDACHIRLDGGVVLKTRPNPDLAKGAAALVSVRPEKCTLLPGSEQAEGNAVPAVSVETVAVGSELQYQLRLDNGDPLRILALNVDSSYRPAPGERVTVNMPPHHCQAFARQAEGVSHDA